MQPVDLLNLLNPVGVAPAFLNLLKQLVATLLGEHLKVPNRPRIRTDDLKDQPSFKRIERLFRLQ